MREHAVRLFAYKGYNAVSMRELAACLGLSAGSLYNHIESKEALLFEFIEELYEVLRVGAEHRPGSSPPRSRLNVLVERHLALHDTMAAHFQLAENDMRQLSDVYRMKAEQARHDYAALLARHCMIDVVSALSLVALLNNAPNWLFGLSPSPGQRVELACCVLRGLFRVA
ncbi:TetR/AcrR family transcriptional regulator [Pseudomonas sp. S31]|uniref:TetR/AcrR family transcriptional regulator n=1 Tax=Pseudomonas sp. S31 TaxID=1564473 RepID=UPI001F249B26|nr:TetR/AcrR family transcriptional regulator [Pseudomonas sp. S31]